MPARLVHPKLVIPTWGVPAVAISVSLMCHPWIIRRSDKVSANRIVVLLEDNMLEKQLNPTTSAHARLEPETPIPPANLDRMRPSLIACLPTISNTWMRRL